MKHLISQSCKQQAAVCAPGRESDPLPGELSSVKGLMGATGWSKSRSWRWLYSQLVAPGQSCYPHSQAANSPGMFAPTPPALLVIFNLRGLQDYVPLG